MRPLRLPAMTLACAALAGCVQLDVALEGAVDPGVQPLAGGVPMTFDRTGEAYVGWRPARLPRGHALERFGVVLVDAAPLGALAPAPARAHPVLVSALERGSPLAHAGVRPFDALVSVAGRPARTLADAVGALSAVEPGATVRLEVARGDEAPRALEVVAAPHAQAYGVFKVPLLVERQASAGGWSLGLGPLDVLFAGRRAVEHWAVPPPRAPGAPEGAPAELPALGEARPSRSRFRERAQWAALWGLVGWEREAELPQGEERSRLRLFWLFTVGDDPAPVEAAGEDGA